MSRPDPGRAGRGRPHEVRIIGGTWRSRRLPVAHAPGLRPTPDRVRETLFNWLGQNLGGWRVLDAFAGTGALGLEAASRGAQAVTLLEREARLHAGLHEAIERLQASAFVSAVRADALEWMARCAPASFDLVLLDPPFDAGLGGRAVELARPLLRPGGSIYLESARPLEPLPAGLAERRRLRAGGVSAQWFTPAAPAGGGAGPAG